MKRPRKAPANTLITESGAPPFFVRRFVGRKEAPAHGTHSHRFLEVIVVESGCGSHALADRRDCVKAGDVFVIAPGEEHNPDGLDTTTHWVVAFDLSFISRSVQSNESLYSGLPAEVMLLGFARPNGPQGFHVALPEDMLAAWLERLRLLAGEFSRKELGYRETTYALLSLMLIDLARLAARDLPYTPGPGRSKIGQFFAVLEEEFRQPATLQTFARRLGSSSAYLTHLVKSETGKTVMEWLTTRRLSEAQRLLRESAAPVKSVSYDVGYRDPGLFNRHFTRQIGQSPAQWRETVLAR